MEPRGRHRLRNWKRETDQGSTVYRRCTKCAATFASVEAARESRASCPGRLVPHAHPLEREHVTEGRWAQGTAALCDDEACLWCVRHGCDCDVCREVLSVPSLARLHETHSTGRIWWPGRPVSSRVPRP